MDTIDTIRLLSDLEGECCGLNHGPETVPRDCPASDFIVIPFGDSHAEIHAPAHELVVPVCLECARALIGEEWTLLYCFECHASRWVNRTLSKNSYRHHILWLKGCPECIKAFGGLFFNDVKTASLDVEFPVHLNRRAAA